MVEHTMDVTDWLRKQLVQASPDLPRAMVKEMAEALMGAEADAICGAGYGERSLERVNRRNGYRERDWDTRVGSIELGVPKLREGSYFPDWLLQPRRRAEQAFVAGAGVSDGSYSLGGLEVETRNGVARGPDGVLAGSALTMVAAVRNLHALGVPLPKAVEAATVVPARVVGNSEVGRIEVGGLADVIVLDDNLEIDCVLVGGEALVVC